MMSVLPAQNNVGPAFSISRQAKARHAGTNKPFKMANTDSGLLTDHRLRRTLIIILALFLDNRSNILKSKNVLISSHTLKYWVEFKLATNKTVTGVV